MQRRSDRRRKASGESSRDASTTLPRTFAKEKGIVYNDIVDAYDNLKRSHISNIDLRLMKDKLIPQERRSSAVIIQMNQSSEEIKQQAGKCLKTIAGIMNLQNTTYGTK